MHIALLVKDFAVGEKFSKDGLPTKSGAEFHAENHAKELIKRGHTVTIFTRKRHFYTKARECMDGIDLVRLHEPLRGLELLVRLLTTHKKIDAFYIIGMPSFAVWAIRFAHARNFPVTLALTGTFEVFDKGMNWRNRIFSTCTNYVAIAHEICEGYKTHGQIPAEKISVLAQGIDTERYAVGSVEKRKRLREAYSIPSEAHVLVFCARIVLRKGVDTLLKFWPMIHAADATARLLVVGGGEHELVRQLHEMAKETDGSALIGGKWINLKYIIKWQMSMCFRHEQKGFLHHFWRRWQAGCLLSRPILADATISSSMARQAIAFRRRMLRLLRKRYCIFLKTKKSANGWEMLPGHWWNACALILLSLTSLRRSYRVRSRVARII